MNSAHEQWHWQEPGEAWKGAGIYHVTLTIPSREPLLGTLVIPDNDPKQAYIQRTELGESLVNEIFHMGSIHPQIRILQFCLMPDHLHMMLHVRKETSVSIRSIVRGFWQGAKRLGREYTFSIDPEFNSGTTKKVSEDSLHHAFPIFTEQPYIRPLSRYVQLQTMFDYIRMNPQRLATKRLMPELYRVQDGIEIAGRIYKGVGNAELLLRARYMPVHVRHTMIDEAMHGDDKRLRDYMNSCVLAARQGAVMVSPFISDKEKEVLIVLLAEGHNIILLADNGFGEYYKPSDGIFDAVANKQVLILSPWPYDPKKHAISRAECVALNNMAEEISSLTSNNIRE
ncbi:MAG: transposase [Paludibacteraceae bacterium]|nr:transposase [Paludibacteraceae bacterium]